jgi:hypothetical protein
MQHTIETPKQYQCRHIFTDGRRCASPCLRQEEFCYYHHTTRKPIANPKQRRSRTSTFHLPLPEDRSAIQASIGEVLQRIAANDIDPRRAGLLLYGLQIASLNLPKQQNTQRHAKPEPIETVEEITIDPTLGVLAPRAEVSGITKRKSVVAELLERMMQSEQATDTPAIGEVAPEPAIVPTLQATEDNPDIAVLPNAIQNWSLSGQTKFLKRPAAEKIDQFDHQNDDDRQLQEEGSALVELVHHEAIQLLGGAYFSCHELFVVGHAYLQGSQLIEAR